MPGYARGYGVQVRLEAMRLERPRQWGACWLFTELWAHKEALFSHLQQRWKDLFSASFDVLLYDLTSTYVNNA